MIEYRKVNREVRQKMKAAKEEWTEEQCKDIEEGMMSGNGEKAYNTLEVLTKIQQHTLAVVEDSNRSILTESTAVLNRWTEYYSIYTRTNSMQTLAFSRVNRLAHKRLKAYLC